MPLPVPNLDDRDYAALLRDAKALVPTLAPEWTDLSPGDPGVALLECSASSPSRCCSGSTGCPEGVRRLLNLVGVAGPPAVARRAGVLAEGRGSAG